MRNNLYVLALILSILAVSCENKKESPTEFKLLENTVSATSEERVYSLSYELKNPINGMSVAVSGYPEWITGVEDTGSSIEISVSQNPTTKERTCRFEVAYDKFKETVSITQAGIVLLNSNFTITAEAASEFEANVTISIDLENGDAASDVSEYGFVYGTGTYDEDVIDNGTWVLYPYSEKGASFTETVECLMPDNVRYLICTYVKYTDGHEQYSGSYEYFHYWEERTKLYDIQGNEYPVFCSGDRYWMGADLRVEKYNDGGEIPNLQDNDEWVNASEGAYCYYDNNTEYAEIYGALYNFNAASSGKICPQGWSLPTSREWKDLAVSQGGKENHDEYGDYFPALGVKFKTADYWTDNKKGKNTFGFNGVPGGCRRFNDGLFNVMGTVAYYWSADEIDEENALVYYLRLYNFANVTLGKQGGFSLRCIRNIEK